MEDKHLLTEIHIKDFKCFKDFKADGFKRVNLIGGKNNVGKTAFMEACYVNVRAQNIKNFVGALGTIKGMRENLNILAGDDIDTKRYVEQSNNIYTKSNINLTSFNIKDEEGIKQYIFEFNKQYVKVNINDFSYEVDVIEHIEFIDNFGWSNGEIINSYSAIQKKDEEAFLNSILNKFDRSIEAFKVIDDKPQCKVKDNYFEVISPHIQLLKNAAIALGPVVATCGYVLIFL
jgi:AAA15 family ATPase/GTPase